MEREEGREERAENTGLGCVAGSLGSPESMESEPRKLENEVLRRPKALPEASWTPAGLIGTLWGRSLGALGSPLGAPGSLLSEVLGALGIPGDAFGGVPLQKHRKP